MRTFLVSTESAFLTPIAERFEVFSESREHHVVFSKPWCVAEDESDPEEDVR